jgi:hypothetical protein
MEINMFSLILLVMFAPVLFFIGLAFTGAVLGAISDLFGSIEQFREEHPYILPSVLFVILLGISSMFN